MDSRHPASAFFWTIAVFIAAAALGFMLYASSQEAAIVDESAHIPAGYGYVRHLDFRLNPEHPPLVKALAALPLLPLEPHFPNDIAAWTTELNGQWNMGEQFLYKSGNDADQIVRAARLLPILLTILLILFIYFWSRQLVGGAWALLPTFLFAISPTVLAHGHYVTTDIGAAFGVLFATYFFLKFLRNPSPRNIIFAGLALGIAELMKFSVVLLIPFFIILAVVRFCMDSRGVHGTHYRRLLLRKLGQFILVFLIALALIYIVYALFVINYPLDRQVADTRANLTGFAGGELAAGESCGLMRCLAEANVWMAGNPATRPLAQYFLGMLMVMQRSVGGNTNYFLGEVSGNGSHLYFPIVYLLKESLPVLILLLTALVLALRGIGRGLARGQGWYNFKKYLHEHFTEFALILFLGIYWAYSVKSTLNIGVRHLMPVIPIMYMLAALAWRRWIARMRLEPGESIFSTIFRAARSLAGAWLKLSLLSALLIWTLLETFAAAPYFLSYFNQIGGGTWNGYRYATDSNYDWGQDMLRLRDFVAAHPEIDKIAVDHFGTMGAPVYYLGDRGVNWWSARGNPADEGIRWFAVSVYYLENSLQPTSSDFVRKPDDSYEWLRALRPIPAGMGQVPTPEYRVGTTIFIYQL